VTITAKIDIPDFRRQLREVESRMQKRIAGGAARAAAMVFAKAARNRAPKLERPVFGKSQRIPGALRRGIVVARGRRNTARGAVRYYISVRSGKKYARRGKGDPFYWRFLEAGWHPRGRGQKLRGGKRLRALLLDRSIQAGARKVQYPFFLPAFRAAGPDALAAFNRRMNEGIAKLRDVR
jgi:hypothetical protein